MAELEKGGELFSRMVIREREPRNVEFPFSSLDSAITPNDRFYIRCHFPIPKFSKSGYQLKIEGRIETPMQFTLDQLKGMPSTRRVVTLECAGNGRIFLTPQVKGAQWELGAVSTAEWTGVPLSHLVKLVQPQSDAFEVILHGADKGKAKEPPAPAGEVHYSRSLPLSKATDDVLLAYEMNGEPLSPAHGFPVRAIVPHWYGMASVKWLDRIIITNQLFQGYFQTTDYAYWATFNGMPVRTPITEMQTKAQIARPAPYERVLAGSHYRIHGAAWSGTNSVSKVEVSTDTGKTFSPAALTTDPFPGTWRLWNFDWTVPAEKGPRTLLARAFDSSGQPQPMERDSKWGTYVISHVLPIEVEVG